MHPVYLCSALKIHTNQLMAIKRGSIPLVQIYKVSARLKRTANEIFVRFYTQSDAFLSYLMRTVTQTVPAFKELPAHLLLAKVSFTKFPLSLSHTQITLNYNHAWWIFARSRHVHTMSTIMLFVGAQKSQVNQFEYFYGTYCVRAALFSVCKCFPASGAHSVLAEMTRFLTTHRVWLVNYTLEKSLPFLSSHLTITYMNITGYPACMLNAQRCIVLTFNTLYSLWDKETNCNRLPPLMLAECVSDALPLNVCDVFNQECSRRLRFFVCVCQKSSTRHCGTTHNRARVKISSSISCTAKYTSEESPYCYSIYSFSSVFFFMRRTKFSETRRFFLSCSHYQLLSIILCVFFIWSTPSGALLFPSFVLHTHTQVASLSSALQKQSSFHKFVVQCSTRKFVAVTSLIVGTVISIAIHRLCKLKIEQTKNKIIMSNVINNLSKIFRNKYDYRMKTKVQYSE